MSLNRFKFKDICISISDGDHLAPPKSDKGVPFITISNITSQNQIDFSDTTCVPFEYYENLDEKRKARKNDILYSVVGTFGKPVLIKRDLKFAFQRHIAILRPNIDVVDPTFLYYVMSSRGFYKIADTLAIGAAQRTITLTSLRNLDISLPPLETQNRIASILSRYDDLIENYQHQIQLLEEAAQRLYKEWFVDLHFPGYENTNIVDGVPEGWEKKGVDDVFLIKYGKNLSTKEISSTGRFPVYGANGVIGYYDKCNCERQVVLITSRGNGSGDVSMTYHNMSFVTNNSFIVTPKQEYEHCELVYIYYLLSNANFRAVRTGAAQPQLTNANIHNVDIILPNKDIILKYNIKVRTNYTLITQLKNQINLLTEARDRLLPKLMSGEITV